MNITIFHMESYSTAFRQTTKIFQKSRNKPRINEPLIQRASPTPRQRHWLQPITSDNALQKNKTNRKKNFNGPYRCVWKHNAVLTFRVSRLPVRFHFAPLPWATPSPSDFCFPRAPLFSAARPAYSVRGGGSTFQNVCKRLEYPAHPNMVHTLEKIVLSSTSFHDCFLLLRSRGHCEKEWEGEGERKCKKYESVVTRKVGGWRVKRVVFVAWRRSRSMLHFRETVPGSGRRSYHRFVAATVSSFKKGTPRVLGDGKTSFPDIYFCLSKGPGNSLRTIWGHFTCFLTWAQVVGPPLEISIFLQTLFRYRTLNKITKWAFEVAQIFLWFCGVCWL